MERIPLHLLQDYGGLGIACSQPWLESQVDEASRAAEIDLASIAQAADWDADLALCRRLSGEL